MNTVIIGNIAFDNNFFLKDGQLIRKTIGIGGACLYAAVPASRFGLIGIVSRVGNDFNFEYIKRFNIDTKGVKVINSEKTIQFYQKYYSQDGSNRSVSGEINKKMYIDFNDVPVEYYYAKHIHITTNEPSVQLSLIENLRKKTNAIISVDTIQCFSNNPLTKKVFDLVDIAFIDYEFSELLNSKAPLKIIKYGKRGCKYVDNKESFFSCANVIENVVDATGAGDCLCGVFVNLISNGYNKKRALDMAVSCASNSVMCDGIYF